MREIFEGTTKSLGGYDQKGEQGKFYVDEWEKYQTNAKDYLHVKQYFGEEGCKELQSILNTYYIKIAGGKPTNPTLFELAIKFLSAPFCRDTAPEGTKDRKSFIRNNGNLN